MMKAGQWVPIGPFQVCPDHDEGGAVLIYDEQTHELHVPREMGPFRIRVTVEAPYGSISAHYEDLGRQGMEALADTMASLDAGPRCDIAPPPGFARCTRALGHNGPCAMPGIEWPPGQCGAASSGYRCALAEFHVGPHDYQPHPTHRPAAEVEPCRRVSLGTMMERREQDRRRCWQPKGHAGSCGPFLPAPHPTSRPEQG